MEKGKAIGDNLLKDEKVYDSKRKYVKVWESMRSLRKYEEFEKVWGVWESMRSLRN